MYLLDLSQGFMDKDILAFEVIVLGRMGQKYLYYVVTFSGYFLVKMFFRILYLS